MSLFSAAYDIIILLLFLLTITRCNANTKKTIQCEKPSSCGDIPKISYPFRLHDDPINCGDPNYELFCEKNTTVLYSDTKRFVVRSIDYKNRTVSVVDDAIQKKNCSTLPSNSFLSSYVYPFESEYYSSSESIIRPLTWRTHVKLNWWYPHLLQYNVKINVPIWISTVRCHLELSIHGVILGVKNAADTAAILMKT
ncbi:hypothetical protein ACFE04_009563 [Oxalis oulophora]